MLKREQDIKTLYEIEQDLFKMAKETGVISINSISEVLSKLDNVIISIINLDYDINEKYKQDILDVTQDCSELNKPWEEYKEIIQAILLNAVADKIGSKLDSVKYELDITQEENHIPHLD